MGDVVDTQEQAAALELAPLLVLRPLEAILDAAGLGSGPIEAERIGEGHSNLTFLLRRGADRFVLRRPPRPPLPPSAHDVLREARLLRTLEGTRVPVPRVLYAHESEEPLGVPFYVMDHVEGSVVTRAVPAALDTPEERGHIAESLIATLAELHAVDWQAVGLEGFGRPTGYLERQLMRFKGLWELTKTRELPRLDDVSARLATTMPESPTSTIVHGDYRLGNVMLAPEPPARIVALFDWELSTIGDPLADVGYLTATWAKTGTTLDLSPVTSAPGFPTADELVARYEELTGRAMARVHWYQALGLWKAAVFMEGNYRRWLAGTTDDAYYSTMDVGVPALVDAAYALTELDRTAL